MENLLPRPVKDHNLYYKILIRIGWIMKYTSLIIFVHCSLVMMLYAKSGVSQNLREVTVKLKVKNQLLEKAFEQIEAQSRFKLVYNSELIKEVGTVSYNKEKVSVESALKELLPQTLKFEQTGSNILISKKPEPVPVKPPTFPVTGKVVDETGLPLPGVTVRVAGTNKGAVTDVDGNFIVQVSSGKDQLTFSFIGYKSQTITIGNDKSFSIKLLPTPQNALDEVVVRAFGTQRKIETLGAQSQVSVAELKQPVANITTVLAGRISGLVGVQRSAEPGLDGANLWVRGVNTFTSGSSSPLILVDGIERSFNNLDPNDIESFSILKDASSTAVYGVRGANGVILITTKRGKPGRTTINLDYYQGMTEFTRVPQVAEGVTYMQMANEASVTRGGTPIYSADRIQKTYTQEDPYLYPNVNWMNEIFNDFGNNRKANLNISGGSDRMTFYVSAGYYDETGLFKVDELQKYDSKIAFTRYNFTSSMIMKPTKTTTIDLGIKGWISNGNYPGTGTEDIFREVYETYPIIYPTMYPGGKEPFTSTGGGMNSPYALLTNRGYVTNYNNQINSDIRVKQDLNFWVKGLSAYVLYSFDAANDNRIARTKTPTTYYATGRDANGELVYTTNPGGSDFLDFSKSTNGSRQFYLESAVNYDQTFGKHHVGGLVLFNRSDRISATAGDLIGSLPYRSLGLVGRLNYSYNDKYLLEASFGYNGAENFDPKNRYGFFPSGAVGWVVSNEKFWGNLKSAVQLLKLRASYGLVGNSKIDGRRFAYIGTVASTTGYTYSDNRGNSIGGYDIGDYAASVTWETEKDLNLGIEFNTFKDALSVQFDWFNRRRENIFLSRAAVPSFIGLRSNLLGNLGITDVKGVDISTVFNKNFGKVGAQIRGTLTYNKNKVIENDQPVQPYPYMEARGQSISQRFGYIADGYYSQEEIDDPAVARTTGDVRAGDLKFRDLNGDGVIDGLDKTAIGQGDIPKIVYGFGTTLSYKGFSLGAFFQGVDKVDLYLSREFMPFRNGSARGGLYSNIKDRWTEDDPRQDAFYPRLFYGSDINQNYSVDNSHWLFNGRFLRLKTLDFGYTLKKGALKSFGVQNMRIYFIGYNLLTFSPFKMYDPELGNGSGTRYPNIRTYSLGVNMSF
ncbi:SusC/RagA family TonB-linked outer membrane protein [Arcticibacter tournemirensis]